MNITKNEIGITLIALIITIIILLILVGVTITKLTESGLFARTQEAKEKSKISQYIEAINLARTETNMNKITSGAQDVDVLVRIQEILEKQDLFKNANFNFDNVNRILTITTEEGYVFEVTDDGQKYLGKSDEINTMPNEATIELSATNTTTLESITATITHSDNERRVDIANCKWVYNTISGTIGTDSSSYTETFSSNPETIILSTTVSGTYYLHVLTTDIAGNVIETISNAVTVEVPLLAEKVSVGDYVQYTPDTVSTTDETYTNLISELGIYSGSTANTTSTLAQESLNWRVLDITKYNDGKSTVRLISELPTTSTVTLYGENGYNNAVYLIDKICNTLYSKTGYTEKAQNLKIEDIQKYMKITDYSTIDSNYGNTFTPNYKYYPSIFAQEEGQTVDETTGTLGLSEQNEPINQTTRNQATSWTVKYTNWNKSMVENDFTDSIYYNLFINNGNNYNTYWMSSRSAGMGTGSIGFGVRCVSSGDVSREALENSAIDSRGYAHAFRPVITLKSDAQIDTTDVTKDGSKAENAWVLKNY